MLKMEVCSSLLILIKDFVKRLLLNFSFKSVKLLNIFMTKTQYIEISNRKISSLILNLNLNQVILDGHVQSMKKPFDHLFVELMNICLQKLLIKKTILLVLIFGASEFYFMKCCMENPLSKPITWKISKKNIYQKIL